MYWFITGNSNSKHAPWITATISHVNAKECCVDCYFQNNSSSACVIVYYQSCSHPYGLVNVSTIKLDRVEEKANGCIEFHNPDYGGYHIAVFAFSSDKKMIDRQPLATSFTGYRRLSTETGIAFMTSIHIHFIFSSFFCRPIYIW